MKCNRVKLEGVQFNDSLYISYALADADYKSRLVSLKLLPLSLSREVSDLKFLFRCRLGLYDLDLSKFITVYIPTRRTRRATKRPLYNSSYYKTETFAQTM